MDEYLDLQKVDHERRLAFSGVSKSTITARGEIWQGPESLHHALFQHVRAGLSLVGQDGKSMNVVPSSCC